MASTPVQRLLDEGMAFHQAGRASDAALSYSRARQLDPKNWPAHQYGGMAALLLGRTGEALQLFSLARALNPKAVVSAVALGLTKFATGDAAGGEAALRDAVKLDPRNSEAWDNLGLLLKSTGRLDEALRCHSEAVRTGPKNVMAWVNHGVALLGTSRVWDAAVCFERALRLDKQNLSALGGRATCLYRSHRSEEAAREFAALFSKNPGLFQFGSYHLMASNNLDTLSPEELWHFHQVFGKAAGGPLRQMPCRCLGAERPLRVAFLSCDLKGHSVSYFLKPLLKGAAAAGVELLLYHDNGIEDSTSMELKKYSAVWRNVSGQLDAVVEKRILEDAPDVLVDLAGHTGSNRLPMLAHRLAPVQISYLGYPNTTGVQAMDYRFVDEITDPIGDADRQHSEKLVRFSSCNWAYEAPVDSPGCRDDCGGQKAPVFGCFNHASKITDTMMAIWARLIAANPTSRLLIKSPGLDHAQVKDPLVSRLRAAGVDLKRTEVIGTTQTVAEHLALYHRVDVALDTSPYNGTTTTCEALWMGVPVVTLAGSRHAARVGESLLKAIGRPDLVVHSADEYVEKASELVRPQAGRGGSFVSSGVALREAMRTSVLMDHGEQARRFWAAIRSCAVGAV